MSSIAIARTLSGETPDPARMMAVSGLDISPDAIDFSRIQVEPNHPGYNINADVAACEVAMALKAQKVIFLTDTIGVLNKNGELIQTLDKQNVEMFKKDGTIAGGMIPKVDSCIEAIHNGVNKAHIIDGRVEHSILLELFTSEGVGTQFLLKE